MRVLSCTAERDNTLHLTGTAPAQCPSQKPRSHPSSPLPSAILALGMSGGWGRGLTDPPNPSPAASPGSVVQELEAVDNLFHSFPKKT